MNTNVTHNTPQVPTARGLSPEKHQVATCHLPKVRLPGKVKEAETGKDSTTNITL